MLKRLRTAVLLLTLVSVPGVVLPAEQDAPAEAPSDFVSGTVVEMPPGKLVVNRAVVGKPPENHTFTLTSATRIEGKLRVHARVTVGFKTSDEGEAVAVRVIVRPSSERKP